MKKQRVIYHVTYTCGHVVDSVVLLAVFSETASTLRESSIDGFRKCERCLLSQSGVDGEHLCELDCCHHCGKCHTVGKACFSDACCLYAPDCVFCGKIIPVGAPKEVNTGDPG